LSSVRADDLAAIPLAALAQRNPKMDLEAIDDVIFGCVNQAGEDNRNVARMGLLLAGYPVDVPASTVNRLCGSGMDAIGTAARAIRSGEIDLAIAGGVESMSRSPFVMPKSEAAFGRKTEIHDTTIGWRFVNDKMTKLHGSDPMAVTAENVADEYGVTREAQDAMALRSQQRARAAQESGFFAAEIVPVTVTQKGKSTIVDRDEHPRDTTLEALAKLKSIVRPGGTVTAGNASGVNDAAAAVILASEQAVRRHGLVPRARLVAMATAGVAPRVMGIGPVPATKKLLAKTGCSIMDIDIVELNEAFAAQGLAVMRELGLADDASHVNPNGGAIALGHPLGMSGTRLVLTAVNQMHRCDGKRAVATMCIGVGQGIATLIERV
jgi:3-oxoadipyl-CoA thiolase